MYSVSFLKSAQRDLSKLDRSTVKRIVDRIEWLSLNVHSTKLFPLKGELAGLYKLREGHYRIFYQMIPAERAIVIHAIGHRRDVYRKR